VSNAPRVAAIATPSAWDAPRVVHRKESAPNVPKNALANNIANNAQKVERKMGFKICNLFISAGGPNCAQCASSDECKQCSDECADCVQVRTTIN
jgi:hypothetical protein